jgi:hypothetical protein
MRNFLAPKWGKKNIVIQNGQVKQMEEVFLCPLPCATVDRIGVCHSISLTYIAHVAVIIHHNLRLYGLPISIAEITLRWCVMYSIWGQEPLFLWNTTTTHDCWQQNIQSNQRQHSEMRYSAVVRLYHLQSSLCISFHTSNSSEIYNPMPFANEAYQFQRKLWKNCDVKCCQ